MSMFVLDNDDKIDLSPAYKARIVRTRITKNDLKILSEYACSEDSFLSESYRAWNMLELCDDIPKEAKIIGNIVGSPGNAVEITIFPLRNVEFNKESEICKCMWSATASYVRRCKKNTFFVRFIFERDRNPRPYSRLWTREVVKELNDGIFEQLSEYDGNRRLSELIEMFGSAYPKIDTEDLSMTIADTVEEYERSNDAPNILSPSYYKMIESFSMLIGESVRGSADSEYPFWVAYDGQNIKIVIAYGITESSFGCAFWAISQMARSITISSAGNIEIIIPTSYEL